jgi:hypothetical protein
MEPIFQKTRNSKINNFTVLTANKNTTSEPTTDKLPNQDDTWPSAPTTYNISIYVKGPKFGTSHFIHQNTQATPDTNNMHSDNTHIPLRTKVRNIATSPYYTSPIKTPYT